MSEYKPNSHKFKAEQASQEEKKKVEKVVKGVVKTKKKNEIHKLADIFIAEDIRTVKSYALMEVLVPAIKKAVSDIVTNGIDMILYGGSGRPSDRSRSSKVSYVSYNKFSEREERRTYDSGSRTRFDYDDLVFDNRGEAQVVLDHLMDTIESYGMATIADMYDLAGITPPFTSNRYGWTSLKSASIERVRDGYIIKTPKAIVID